MKFLQKFSFIFSAILIVFIPLQTLAIDILLIKTQFSARASFWLVHWYEPFVLILALLGIIFQFRNKISFSFFQKIIFLFLMFGIISIFFISPTIRQGLEGFRISLFFLLAFFVGFLIERKDQQKLIKVYLVTAILIALWAVIERFLPAYYWIKWFDLPESFGFGSFLVGKTVRSASLIGGPNQLGSYLLPAAFLIIPFIFDLKDKIFKFKTFPLISYGLIVSAIAFSYSRAAVIGLIVGFVIYSLINFRHFFKIILLAIVTAFCVALPFYISVKSGDSVNTVVTHDTSQIGHNVAIADSISEIKSRIEKPTLLLLGEGIGTAGPLVFKYGNGIISESWYLQIALELGLLGLLLWLILALSGIIALIKKSSELLVGFIAVSTVALVLHTFADNPAISLTLFLLIGVAFNNMTKLEKNG